MHENKKIYSKYPTIQINPFSLILSQSQKDIGYIDTILITQSM